MKINRTDLPGRARELAAAIQKRYPKADEYPYRSWSYPQGYLLMGFIHLWEKTGDELYYQYVLAYCLDHVEEDGSVRGFTECSMDDMMAGAVLVWMYEQTGRNGLRQHAERSGKPTGIIRGREKEGFFITVPSFREKCGWTASLWGRCFYAGTVPYSGRRSVLTRRCCSWN